MAASNVLFLFCGQEYDYFNLSIQSRRVPVPRITPAFEIIFGLCCLVVSCTGARKKCSGVENFKLFVAFLLICRDLNLDYLMLSTTFSSVLDFTLIYTETHVVNRKFYEEHLKIH